MLRSAYLVHLKLVKGTNMYRFINFVRTSSLYLKKNKNCQFKSIHSSTQLYFIKNNEPNNKVDQNSRSLLGEDLKNILNSVTADETKLDNLNEKKPVVEKKGLFSNLFSRENNWKITLIIFGSMFGFCVVYVLTNWGAPKLDENNQPIKDEFSSLPFYMQYPKRAMNEVVNYYTVMKDPIQDKLLPDPLQYPYVQPQYTLVIEMTGLLLHPEWTFNTGWRYKKRPGLDYFLEQVRYPIFEVVLFSRESTITGAPIAANLDPQGMIHHKLFRESTKFINNHYVKDMTYMNRDLDKIILIDWDEHSYELQPRNALHRLKKWEGDDKDTDLVYLASFLKMIAASNVSDVREVLDYYNQESNPLDTFKLNQVKIAEADAQRQQELDEMKYKQKKSTFSFFRR
jgi:mitochondrial import inner membrane translocase subunit TIM50